LNLSEFKKETKKKLFILSYDKEFAKPTDEPPNRQRIDNILSNPKALNKLFISG
jgi:hypothetical protein